jgi:hypothetical protein
VIIQHGFWLRYRPDPFPEGLPPMTLFARRESDGIDWYEFLRSDELSADSVKMTVAHLNGRWIILTAHWDGSMLFPADALVIEVEGVDHNTDLLEMFAGREFYPDKNEIGEMPLPPTAALSRRQFFQIGAMKGLITYDEALAAVQHGAIPASVEEYIKSLPADQQFSARMLIAGASEFDRYNPMTESLAHFMGLTDDQLDALWREGAQL